MAFRLLLRVSAFAVIGCLGSAGPALADAITFWNNIAQAAIPTGRTGPIGVVDSALIQGAVYDAVQSIERDFKPYHVRIPGLTDRRITPPRRPHTAAPVGLIRRRLRR